MKKITTLIVLIFLLIILPAIVLANAQEDEIQKVIGLQVSSWHDVELDSGRKKLSPEILNFKTKQEEKIEKHNQERLALYEKRLEKSRLKEGEYKILVTGYSSTPDQCSGNPFITASGTRVHRGTMACPPQYPFGTKIKIKDLGTFICEDRGGAIKGNHFDMWFTSREEALTWGKRTLVATITK